MSVIRFIGGKWSNDQCPCAHKRNCPKVAYLELGNAKKWSSRYDIFKSYEQRGVLGALCVYLLACLWIYLLPSKKERKNTLPKVMSSKIHKINTTKDSVIKPERESWAAKDVKNRQRPGSCLEAVGAWLSWSSNGRKAPCCNGSSPDLTKRASQTEPNCNNFFSGKSMWEFLSNKEGWMVQAAKGVMWSCETSINSWGPCRERHHSTKVQSWQKNSGKLKKELPGG